MSDSPMPWLKLHTRLLDDPRFGRLPDSTQARYYKLLMLAGKCDAGGAFYKGGEQLTEDDIAYALHTTADELRPHLEALKGCGYVCLNGHGWEIASFELEQGPTQEEKRAGWRVRQNKHREKLVTSDTPVSHASKSQESESRVKSQSQEKESVKEPTADDIFMTDQKRLICTASGIPPKYSQILISSPTILPDDILAELSRNYARIGKVKNPGYITGMNLAKPDPERPAADWYSQDRWLMHLPGALKQKFGLCLKSDDNEVETLPAVVTRSDDLKELSPDERAWQNALDQLPHNALTHLEHTELISCDGNVFKVECPDNDSAEWLDSRVKSMLEHSLVGICNRNIAIEFVSRGPE